MTAQRAQIISRYEAELFVLRRKRADDFQRINHIKFVLRHSYGVEPGEDHGRIR